MYRPGMACELEAGIVGRDLDALCDFYTQVMGFTLVERLDAPAGTVCKLRRDAARLKLFKPPGPVDPKAWATRTGTGVSFRDPTGDDYSHSLVQFLAGTTAPSW